MQKPRDNPMEGDFYAGSIPKVYDIKSEIMGLAVFDGAKMVGKLDGGEALCQQMLYGNFSRSNMAIPDKDSPGNYILLDIKQSRKPTHKVTIKDGVPNIYAKVRLEADILSIQSGENLESAENLPYLESMVQDYIKSNMMDFLEKTKEMNSDICGFGRALKMKYVLWDDWTKVHWLSRYKDAVFEIDVELKIRRPGLMIRSARAKSTEGG
jgi:spore germination protein KC